MTAQRADGTGESGEAEEDRHALARLLGAGPGAERAPAHGGPRPSAPGPVPAGARSPARETRFELRAARAPGVFGARFLALDHAAGEEEVWVERLEEGTPEAAHFELRLDALAAELRGLPGLLPWSGSALDARGRRLVAQPARAGESLRELLERRGTLPPEHACEILRQVLAALEPAHARGHAHGSLVAEHVRLAARAPWSASNPFGVALELAGFGLAALLGGPASPADDLRQAEQLLAELVTGVPELEALAPCLPPAISRRLARLGAFASAAEFRAALTPRGHARTGRADVRRRGLFLATLALAGLAASSAWRSQRALARERESASAAARADEDARQEERARSALERFLELLEEGEYGEARLVLAAARAEPPLAARGFGLGFLEAALEAGAGLASGQTETLLERADTLLVARDAHADARQRREAFLLASTEWLATPGPTRAAPRAELLRWFEEQERELARRSAGLERELARAAGELARGGLAPRAALVLARWSPGTPAPMDAADPLAVPLALVADEDALFGREGERFLWRVEAPGGAVAWREDRVRARHEGGARLTRRWLGAQQGAQAEQELQLGWRGSALVFDPPLEATLELARPGRTSHFVPRPVEAAPPELPGAASAALRAALAAGSPWELPSGDGRAWVLPGLGLVRRVLADGTLIELAWRGRP